MIIVRNFGVALRSDLLGASDIRYLIDMNGSIGQLNKRYAKLNRDDILTPSPAASSDYALNEFIEKREMLFYVI